MPRKSLIAAAALVAVATVALAGATVAGSKGSLSAVAGNSGGHEQGRYRMAVVTRTTGTGFERIETFAKRLDATPDAVSGERPAYDVWLVKSDGSAAADFGAMRVNKHGNAKFIFDTRHMVLPALADASGNVASIADYAAGTIEIRNAAGAVMSGAIAAPGSHGHGHHAH
jgi:hypothetical protein